MNAKETEEKFVNNFIHKEQRERSLWTLNHKKKRSDFLDKFNHRWSEMIPENAIMKLNTKSDSDTYEKVKSILKFKDAYVCYVISYNELDGQFVEFKSAFKKCQEIGFASLIISQDGKKIYLKTEQEIGAPAKFIGIQ